MSCCLPAHVVALGDHVAWRALVYLAKGNTSSVKFFERHISPVRTPFRDQSHRIVPHTRLESEYTEYTECTEYTEYTHLARQHTGS